MGVLCSALLASGKLQLFTSRSNHTETMKIPWISDIYVKTCWSPCFWHPTVRSGSYAIAVYTIAMSIIMLMLLILAAVLLIWGITKDVRGLMIPWLGLWFILCLGQAMFGLWLIFGYYIYLEGVFAALVDFAWMSYNIYCWFVVRNHYRNVKWFQSPDIEVLQEYAK